MSNVNNEVVPANSNDWVLANDDVLVVYRPSSSASSSSLDMSRYRSVTFTIKWFDPRNGGSLQNGSLTSIKGGGSLQLVSYGNPPNTNNKDWVALITKN